MTSATPVPARLLQVQRLCVFSSTPIVHTARRGADPRRNTHGCPRMSLAGGAAEEVRASRHLRPPGSTGMRRMRPGCRPAPPAYGKTAGGRLKGRWASSLVMEPATGAPGAALFVSHQSCMRMCSPARMAGLEPSRASGESEQEAACRQSPARARQSGSLRTVRCFAVADAGGQPGPQLVARKAPRQVKTHPRALHSIVHRVNRASHGSVDSKKLDAVRRS